MPDGSSSAEQNQPATATSSLAQSHPIPHRESHRLENSVGTILLSMCLPLWTAHNVIADITLTPLLSLLPNYQTTTSSQSFSRLELVRELIVFLIKGDRIFIDDRWWLISALELYFDIKMIAIKIKIEVSSVRMGKVFSIISIFPFGRISCKCLFIFAEINIKISGHFEMTLTAHWMWQWQIIMFRRHSNRWFGSMPVNISINGRPFSQWF